MSDLSKNDVERASFAFSIYDFEGKGKIDAFNLGDLLRALNSNPTLATIEKLGGTKKKGEKLLTLEEFLPIYSQAKKDKDQGAYEDFLECLKLYDKNENGLMLGAELTHTLLALGEKLDDSEVAEVTKDCMDPEDDDGMIPYAAFLRRMCDGWDPKRPKPGTEEPAPEAPAEG
ncbi:myosin light chain alkali isoform X1 [Bombyx mandarina]|uniref:Myosin light chain alkali n=2 Tax=Bombyx TaxID=7090 RepID=A0A8R2QXX4_BOMMO|nr:myosin light chain alkali isoform X1 [Bombyx mandarina]XP_037867596.1 myosin light chain 1 isoform X1 [Bombyx mori]